MSEPNQNPYAPPLAVVSDASYTSRDIYIPDGRKVPAGNGAAWISNAWGLFKQSPWAWIGMFLLTLVLIFVLMIIPLVGFFSVITTPILTGGIMIACGRQRETGFLNIADLFTVIETHAGPLFIVGLLQFALFIVLSIPVAIVVFITFGAAIFGGSSLTSMLTPAGLATLGVSILLILLLILAGVFVIMSAVWFAPALVVHQGLSPVDAMKASFRGWMRNMGSGTIYMLLALVLYIAVISTFGLAIFVVGPIMQASMYTSYRDIFIEE